MRAADLMRTPVATVKPGTSVIEAARLLLQTNQRGLPVLAEDGELIGIVSEGDLLHRDELGVQPPAGNWLEQVLGIEEGGPARERMHALQVGTIMTPYPCWVDENASIDEVVKVMDSRKIGQVPVVSGGEVVGIISRVQLISALERSLSGDQAEAEAAE